ncbi:MAG: hypothetical protein AMXMBFR81_12220 [Chthonomonas sp.]
MKNQRDFDKQILAAAWDDSPLAPDAERMLDARLRGDDQRLVSHAVANLEQDELSMAWRSTLNERLLELQPAKRKAWWTLAWRPVLATGLAASVLTIAFLRTGPAPSSHAESLEGELIRIHLDSAAALDLAGTGLVPHEVASARPAPVEEELDWSSVDLDLL